MVCKNGISNLRGDVKACYNRSMIRNVILDYIGGLEDFTYLEAALSPYDAPQLVEGIVSLLRDPDQDVVWQACAFICDLILVAPKRGRWLAFRESFVASPIVPTLEDLLLANNHFIRDHAIYTLGKTYSTGSVPALHQVFRSLRDRDPISLPNLIFELKWLGFEVHMLWSLVDSMATSRQFTTRWAALAVLEKHAIGVEPDLGDVVEQCFERLCRDRHPLVKAEAGYRYQQWLLRQQSSTLAKADLRRQYKEIKSSEPAILFRDVEIQFNGYLGLHRLTDYSIADLEQFIAQMMGAEAGPHLNK